jgi:hypothetical protein
VGWVGGSRATATCGQKQLFYHLLGGNLPTRGLEIEREIRIVNNLGESLERLDFMVFRTGLVMAHVKKFPK